MLTLSPMYPTFCLPLEDQTSYYQNWTPSDPFLNFNHKELDSLPSCGYSQLQNAPLHNPMHSGALSSDHSASRKLTHNASERERRQKLNALYSTLRSLLPGIDQKKKLSIPTTISRALIYVPQLQNQVERLIQRKEKILSSLCKHPEAASPQSTPTVSTSQINNREVVIQLCVSKINNKSPFSAVLQNLEEDELQIINASAFASCENKVLYTLHVRAKATQTVECGMLSRKIFSLC